MEDDYELDDTEARQRARKELAQAEATALAALPSVQTVETDTEKPSWASQWERTQAEEKRPKPQRFIGIAARWNVKGGYGFIQRADEGLPDIFVHQRSVHRSGFRSLREGEEVEFETEVSKGRLEAIKVTGPDGVEVLGIVGKGSGKDESDESDSGDEAAGGPQRAKEVKPARPKPYTGFVPRTVKRPVPKASTSRAAASSAGAKPATPAPAPGPAVSSCAAPGASQ